MGKNLAKTYNPKDFEERIYVGKERIFSCRCG